jgi:hypothetical protein
MEHLSRGTTVRRSADVGNVQEHWELDWHKLRQNLGLYHARDCSLNLGFRLLSNRMLLY